MRFKQAKNEYLFSYIPIDAGYWGRKKTRYVVSVTCGAHLIRGTFGTLKAAREWAKELIIDKESHGLRSEKVEV